MPKVWRKYDGAAAVAMLGLWVAEVESVLKCAKRTLGIGVGKGGRVVDRVLGRGGWY